MPDTSMPHVMSRLRPALGTFVAVEAETPDVDSAARAIAKAFEAISRVERLMHPTREGSDLARLAACTPGRPVRIDAWTWSLLELCQRLHHASRGIFDPCLHTAAGRLRDVELVADHGVIARACVHIDLGGIAKGFAVDRAIDALRAAGCAAGLVNAGGDLAAFGARARRIVCRAPHGAAVLDLRDAALATTSVDGSSRPGEHRGHYHGRLGVSPASATIAVLASDAAVADGLTTCLLFAGRARKRRLLEEFDASEVIHQNASPRPRSKRLKSELSSNH